MAEELAVVSSKDMDIQARIMTIRGVQVMQDRDLAALYGVETKALNQAVKRNAERFPEGFMFQLTDAEWLALRSQVVTSNTPSTNVLASLRSQCVTSKRGGQRYRPYVFTEHGVVMLASVLKSEAAVQASLRIVSVFVAMRRALSSMAPLLTRIEAADRREIFWSGASLKDAGRLTFAIAQMGPEVIPGLLASVRKAAK